MRSIGCISLVKAVYHESDVMKKSARKSGVRVIDCQSSALATHHLHARIGSKCNSPQILSPHQIPGFLRRFSVCDREEHDPPEEPQPYSYVITVFDVEHAMRRRKT
ncbi:hypothetical protein RB195_010312 [Necator americanus]|uniref:Uncharacterized protein n=1 Tax=Necator americanus TaxID=51031 RepID=A0ABR1CY36_NECAM